MLNCEDKVGNLLRFPQSSAESPHFGAMLNAVIKKLTACIGSLMQCIVSRRSAHSGSIRCRQVAAANMNERDAATFIFVASRFSSIWCLRSVIACRLCSFSSTLGFVSMACAATIIFLLGFSYVTTASLDLKCPKMEPWWHRECDHKPTCLGASSRPIMPSSMHVLVKINPFSLYIWSNSTRVSIDSSASNTADLVFSYWNSHKIIQRIMSNGRTVWDIFIVFAVDDWTK